MVTQVYGDNPFEMTRELIDKTGALDGLLPDHKVLIKPNIVASRKDWTGINTDPRVVEALVVLLKERGLQRITVADGSGMGSSATRAFTICGYRKMSERYGFRLLDLEKDRFVTRKVPVEGPFKRLEISRTVVESDFVINVPIMKAHMQTRITCSLKNLKGIMPRSQKSAFHGTNLHQAIAQLNRVFSPDLIVVDGLKGDLSFEVGRNPIALETMLLGSNPVEVDSIVASILGYSPGDIRHIAYSAAAGIGRADLDQIKVRQLNLPSVDRQYTPPDRYTNFFPCEIRAQGACSTCLGNLIFALQRLKEHGLLSPSLVFAVGQLSESVSNAEKIAVAVGKCAAERTGSGISIHACPPTAHAIFQRVEKKLKRG
jgi:uncharacterized protein (DUF362 family)